MFNLRLMVVLVSSFAFFFFFFFLREREFMEICGGRESVWGFKVRVYGGEGMEWNVVGGWVVILLVGLKTLNVIRFDLCMLYVI